MIIYSLADLINSRHGIWFSQNQIEDHMCKRKSHMHVRTSEKSSYGKNICVGICFKSWKLGILQRLINCTNLLLYL